MNIQMESLRLRQRILNMILNTPPQAERWISADVKLGAEEVKERSRHTFGKDVGNLHVRGHILGAKLASENQFTKKVVVKLNMLCPFVRDGIGAQED